jgi:Ca2+-binding EF-hand superfamily protein
LTSTSTSNTNYDLNQDGKINSLDLAIISQNNGKKVTEDSSAEIKQADLNKDGLIDKKDSDLLLTAL